MDNDDLSHQVLFILCPGDFACSCKVLSLITFGYSESGAREARSALSTSCHLLFALLSVCRLSQCTIRIHEMMVEGHPTLLLGQGTVPVFESSDWAISGLASMQPKVIMRRYQDEKDLVGHRLSQLSFRRGRSCLPALAKRSCQSGIMKQASSCSCQKPPSAYYCGLPRSAAAVSSFRHASKSIGYGDNSSRALSALNF